MFLPSFIKIGQQFSVNVASFLCTDLEFEINGQLSKCILPEILIFKQKPDTTLCKQRPVTFRKAAPFLHITGLAEPVKNWVRRLPWSSNSGCTKLQVLLVEAQKVGA